MTAREAAIVELIGRMPRAGIDEPLVQLVTLAIEIERAQDELGTRLPRRLRPCCCCACGGQT